MGFGRSGFAPWREAYDAEIADLLAPYQADVALQAGYMLVGVLDEFVLLELKVVDRGLKVSLRPHQIAFMTRQSARGRPCFVLVLQSGGTTLRPAKIHLYRGRDAIDLAAHGLRLPALRSWASRGMPWGELFELLSETETP